ncbi:MAG: Spx/MgsR family RNA polymerase-binding regulatory protein [Cyclobacteriaceae bacterium]
MKPIIYGIKNCNTMKKTFQLFEKENIGYEFIDYKKQAPDESLLRKMINQLGLEVVINKKGMSYRKLEEEDKKAIGHIDTAIPVLIEKPSMIKRPIIEFGDGGIIAGLEEEKLLKRIKEGA